MMKLNVKKTSIALAVIASVLFNGLSFTMAETVEATKKMPASTEYDPFADEVVSPNPVVSNILPGHIYIPRKTVLKVELVNEANSKDLKTDQEIDIRLTENIIINGVVVIPKGTIGTAYVYKSRKSAGLGRKGILQIAGKEIRTLNNIAVPLKKGLSGVGKTDGSAGAVAATVSVTAGILMKGTNAVYPAGTKFSVEVREDVDLMATKDNLKEVMNPNRVRGNEIKVDPR